MLRRDEQRRLGEEISLRIYLENFWGIDFSISSEFLDNLDWAKVISSEIAPLCLCGI